MPTIIENTQQVNALNEIEAALAIIKSINTIISAGDGALAIVYKPEKGRKVQVDVPDASRAKAIGILSTTKDRLVKDVKSKAAKFHIGGDIQTSEPSDEGEPENGQSDTAEGPTENVHSSEESLPPEFEGDVGDDESLI